MEQLLLVTSCDSPAGIGASLWTDARTHARTDSILDITKYYLFTPPFRINLSLKVDDHGRTLYYSILNAFSYTVGVL